ncbi:MAG: hypothetical protein U0746_06995 [Gemmataceae bacterium]
MPGIPRDDLIRYLLEAAEVLDLMHDRYQLQHLDIKPPNMFLVHDHVKVGDFGLEDLQGVGGTITGGVTPTWPRRPRWSIELHRHQYSLAIVYHELLTGQRPFAGGTVQQIILQHIQGKPNLNGPAAVGSAGSRACTPPCSQENRLNRLPWLPFDMSGTGFRLPASLLASLSGRFPGCSTYLTTPTPRPRLEHRHHRSRLGSG